jgi:hypothetical protein
MSFGLLRTRSVFFCPVDLPRLASVHVVRSALWLFVGGVYVLLKTRGFSARVEIESQPAICAETNEGAPQVRRAGWDGPILSAVALVLWLRLRVMLLVILVRL